MDEERGALYSFAFDSNGDVVGYSWETETVESIAIKKK
jgi:hypothetical protein